MEVKHNFRFVGLICCAFLVKMRISKNGVYNSDKQCLSVHTSLKPLAGDPHKRPLTGAAALLTELIKGRS